MTTGEQLALFPCVTPTRDTLDVGAPVYLGARDVRGLGIAWRLRGGPGVVESAGEDTRGTFYAVRMTRSGRLRFARRDELRPRRERMRDRRVTSHKKCHAYHTGFTP